MNINSWALAEYLNDFCLITCEWNYCVWLYKLAHRKDLLSESHINHRDLIPKQTLLNNFNWKVTDNFKKSRERSGHQELLLRSCLPLSNRSHWPSIIDENTITFQGYLKCWEHLNYEATELCCLGEILQKAIAHVS